PELPSSAAVSIAPPYEACESLTTGWRSGLHRSSPAVHQPRDVTGEPVLRVVLGPVAEHLAGVGDAPELPRVVRNAVEDVERHSVLVGHLLGVDAPAHQLLKIASGDVARDVAGVAAGRQAREVGRVDLA